MDIINFFMLSLLTEKGRNEDSPTHSIIMSPSPTSIVGQFWSESFNGERTLLAAISAVFVVVGTMLSMPERLQIWPQMALTDQKQQAALGFIVQTVGWLGVGVSIIYISSKSVRGIVEPLGWKPIVTFVAAIALAASTIMNTETDVDVGVLFTSQEDIQQLASQLQALPQPTACNDDNTPSQWDLANASLQVALLQAGAITADQLAQNELTCSNAASLAAAQAAVNTIDQQVQQKQRMQWVPIALGVVGWVGLLIVLCVSGSTGTWHSIEKLLISLAGSAIVIVGFLGMRGYDWLTDSQLQLLLTKYQVGERDESILTDIANSALNPRVWPIVVEFVGMLVVALGIGYLN